MRGHCEVESVNGIIAVRSVCMTRLLNIVKYKKRGAGGAWPRALAVLVCLVFAGTGAALVLRGKAATVAVSVEAENGTAGTPAATIADSTASGGHQVKFGPGSDGFITRSGTNLMLNGKKFQYIGFDAYGISGCRTGTPWTTAQLDGYFSKLPAKSVTRTWAFQYYGTAAVQTILTEAAKYGQYVILTLGDDDSACNDYDGAPSGDGSGKTLAFYQTGWQGAYATWVKTVVPLFKNNTTVAFWEIANEPGNAGASPSAAQMKAYLDGAAALIKSQDPNHLVGTGANYDGNAGLSDYAYAHSGTDIDLISTHEYAYEYENGAVDSSHIAMARAAAQSLNKPYYVGEAGAPSGQNCLSFSLSARAAYMKQKADDYLSGGAAGIDFWDYEPATVVSGCDYDFNASDPMVAAVQNYVLP